MSLDTLEEPWKSIALDFIVKLLPSKTWENYTYDVILVVTCRLTKIAYFILYNKALDIEYFLKTLFKVVISHYRTLVEIISDRDKLFTSKF